MDSSAASAPSGRQDDGYATAAAAMIALALSLVVSAVMGAALTDLRASKASLGRARIEALLDGAQQTAVVGVLENGAPQRIRWYLPTPQGVIEVLAEPEAAKLSLKAAADLPHDDLLGLGPSNVASIRARLRAMALAGSSADGVSRLTATPLWRACASSMISPYGQGASLSLRAARPPTPGHFSWRAGEVWRLRALSPDGWADDRIVRLTGDAERPAAIIERVLVRGQTGGEPCRVFIEGGA